MATAEILAAQFTQFQAEYQARMDEQRNENVALRGFIAQLEGGQANLMTQHNEAHRSANYAIQAATGSRTSRSGFRGN